MRDVRTPVTAGVLAAVAYVVGTIVPYVAGGVPSDALDTYYTTFGPVGPPYITVLALVALIVLSAGRQGRATLDVVAGVAIVVGLVVTILTAMWAFGGAGDVVGSLSKATWLEYHRWVLLASALGILGSSIWLADAIGVVRGRPEAAS